MSEWREGMKAFRVWDWDSDGALEGVGDTATMGQTFLFKRALQQREWF